MGLPPAPRTGARHIVVDSTGLKVYGAGERHAGKYQRADRRVWRKLHLGVDETTRKILTADVTESRVHDSRRIPTLLSRIRDTIAQVSGDRGYDTRAAYEAVMACGAVATIVPRRNARLGEGADPPPWRVARDANLRAMEVQGRYGWRSSSGCTRQSLAKNAAVFRSILPTTMTAGLVGASGAKRPSTASGLANEFVGSAKAARRGGTATSYGCKGRKLLAAESRPAAPHEHQAHASTGCSAKRPRSGLKNPCLPCRRAFPSRSSSLASRRPSPQW